MQQGLEFIGVPKVYEDYREMLQNEQLDIVIVCAEKTRHGEIVTEVARAGAHIVVEKPMAATYGDAEDNGLVMVRFPKAVAILEGSWSTPHFGVSNGPIPQR